MSNVDFTSLTPSSESLGAAAEAALASPSTIPSSWLEAFKNNEKPTTRLTLIFFCNEFLQRAKPIESTQPYRDEMAKQLPWCFKTLVQQRSEFEMKLKRVWVVWGERETLTTEQLQDIRHEMNWTEAIGSTSTNNNTTTTSRPLKRKRSSFAMQDPIVTKRLRDLDDVAKSLGMLDALDIEPTELFSELLRASRESTAGLVDDYMIRDRQHRICELLFRVVKTLKTDKPDLVPLFRMLQGLGPAEQWEKNEAAARDADTERYEVITTVTSIELRLPDVTKVNEEINTKAEADINNYGHILDLIRELKTFEGNSTIVDSAEDQIKDIDACIGTLEDALTKIKEGSARLAAKPVESMHNHAVAAAPKMLPPVGQRQPWQAAAPWVGGAQQPAMPRPSFPWAAPGAVPVMQQQPLPQQHTPAWMGYQMAPRPTTSAPWMAPGANPPPLNNAMFMGGQQQQPPRMASMLPPSSQPQYGNLPPRPVQPMPFFPPQQQQQRGYVPPPYAPRPFYAGNHPQYQTQPPPPR